MLPITVKEIVHVCNGTLLCGDEDTLVTGASTNSKEIEEGSLFIPIIGERVDGHKFIGMAVENGAVCTFSSVHSEDDEELGKLGCACIRVEDNLKAFQTVAEYVRSKYDIPIVGITGSVGKTTTKEMISAALETKMDVLKTAGNMNSQVGVSLMMFRLEEKHDAAVIEMGISEPNEMANLSRIAKPCFAAVTNIGISHISQFETQENICREKLKIIDNFTDLSECDNTAEIFMKSLEQANLDEANVLFVNGDDEILKKIVAYKKDNSLECCLDNTTKEVINKIKIISYGLSDNCDYKASNIKVVDGMSTFDVENNGKITSVKLNVLGKHNIYNALVAMAVAECFGIDANMAARGLREYRPPAMRGEIKKSNGIIVIDDSYNASPDSMKGGIDILLSIEESKRRIAVLADMFELGNESAKGHYSVGKYIAERTNKGLENKTATVDMVISVGTDSKEIIKGINDNCSCTVTYSFENNNEAIEFLTKELKEGDSVIVKGSRGMHTEEIVQAITNND